MKPKKNLLKKWGQVTIFLAVFLSVINFSFAYSYADEVNKGAVIQQSYEHIYNLERPKLSNSVDEENSQSNPKNEQSGSLDKTNEALGEVKYILNNYYLYDVSNEIKKANSIEELINSLEDPYTSYFSKEDYDNFINGIDKKVDGISTPTVLESVLNKNIGYIKIHSFGEGTGQEFKNVLNDLENKNVSSYIVDLRFNGGGFVTSALDIGGYFIGENPMVLMENKQGTVDSYNAYKQDKIIQKPIIFLIDEYSASASEILSAAVKDYGKAFFIGRTTFGKGVAQSMIPLSSGGVLKFTTHEFFSPKKNEIHHKGITPDFQVDNEGDILDTARLLLGHINGEKISKLKSKKLNEIVKSSGDKVINVKFNKELDVTTVNDKNIELVAQGVEEDISINLKVGKSNNIVVTSSVAFEKGKNYYFLVNDKIKSKDGKSLTAGEAVKIVVTQ